MGSPIPGAAAEDTEVVEETAAVEGTGRVWTGCGSSLVIIKTTAAVTPMNATTAVATSTPVRRCPVDLPGAADAGTKGSAADPSSPA